MGSVIFLGITMLGFAVWAVYFLSAQNNECCRSLVKNQDLIISKLKDTDFVMVRFIDYSSNTAYENDSFALLTRDDVIKYFGIKKSNSYNYLEIKEGEYPLLQNGLSPRFFMSLLLSVNDDMTLQDLRQRCLYTPSKYPLFFKEEKKNEFVTNN